MLAPYRQAANAKGMGDIVTWQGDATVAQDMWGEVAEQGQAGSPGSGGASPYLPGFPWCLAC